MTVATVVGDKQGDFQYHVRCIQAFLMECGRVQAVLNTTILQSDQEDHLIALLKTVAAKMGGNITVRQAPTYTSQAQGSVERFHRTLMGQFRTLKAQLQHNYDRTITSKHPIVPWLVRHTAYLLNRYAVHVDGNTSYFRRWHKDHRHPLCEFGETVQYLLPTSKQLPKMEQRFFPAIWLGRDTTTGETLLGIANKVIRARTIRRMPRPEKYNKQLFDVISRTDAQQLPIAGEAPLPSSEKINHNNRDADLGRAIGSNSSTTRSARRSTTSVASSTNRHQHSEDDNASDRRRTTRNFANQLSQPTSHANTTAKANCR